MENSNFAFYRGSKQKTTKDGGFVRLSFFFYFFFVNLMDNDLKNSTPVKFPYILQIDGNGIIARKLATVPIHF